MSDKKNDWHLLEFFTPIIEFNEVTNEGVEPEFFIKGTAINETTTHNNHKYVAEELEKAGKQLIGKKLLVDHRNEVDAIKGVVTKSYYDPMSASIKFEAVVKDKAVKEMIKDGRLSDVSIGAYASDLIKEDDGSYVAKGLNIMELSLVAVPADSKANFAMAMSDAYNLKESLTEAEMEKCPECKKMIDKDKMKKHMEDNHPQESLNIQNSERRLDKMSEENLQESFEKEKNKLLEELNTLRSEKRQSKVNEYKRLCAEKQTKEKDVSKASDETIEFLIEQLKEITLPKVEEKKEFKSVVAIEESPETNNLVIERNDQGKFAVWEMPDTQKLNRLHKDLPFLKSR